MFRAACLAGLPHLYSLTPRPSLFPAPTQIQGFSPPAAPLTFAAGPVFVVRTVPHAGGRGAASLAPAQGWGLCPCRPTPLPVRLASPHPRVPAQKRLPGETLTPVRRAEPTQPRALGSPLGFSTVRTIQKDDDSSRGKKERLMMEKM